MDATTQESDGVLNLVLHPLFLCVSKLGHRKAWDLEHELVVRQPDKLLDTVNVFGWVFHCDVTNDWENKSVIFHCGCCSSHFPHIQTTARKKQLNNHRLGLHPQAMRNMNMIMAVFSVESTSRVFNPDAEETGLHLILTVGTRPGDRMPLDWKINYCSCRVRQGRAVTSEIGHPREDILISNPSKTSPCSQWQL